MEYNPLVEDGEALRCDKDHTVLQGVILGLDVGLSSQGTPSLAQQRPVQEGLYCSHRRTIITIV